MKKKILAISLCAVLLTGCSPSASISDLVTTSAVPAAQDTSENEIQETEAPEETVYALGEKTSINDFAITAVKASTAKKIENKKYHTVFKPNKKGNQFVYVTIKVRNNGSEKATFLPMIAYKGKDIFAKLYCQDNEYSPTQLLNYDKDLAADILKSKESKKGIIVFEVPKKVAKKKKALTLQFSDGTDVITYSLK